MAFIGSRLDQIHIRYNTEVAESAVFYDLDLNFFDDLADVIEPLFAINRYKEIVQWSIF